MRLALVFLAALALTLPASAAPPAVLNVTAQADGLTVTIGASSSAPPGTPARLRLDVPAELQLAGVVWSGITPACQLKATPPQWLSCAYATPASGQLGALVLLEPGARAGCADGAPVLAQLYTGESSGLARAWVPLPARSCAYIPLILQGD